MEYDLTTRIWLSLEEYHNSGMTSAKTKEIIEQIRDPFGYIKLRCEPMGLNSNWTVETSASHPLDVHEVVTVIEKALNFEQLKAPTRSS